MCPINKKGVINHNMKFVEDSLLLSMLYKIFTNIITQYLEIYIEENIR